MGAENIAVVVARGDSLVVNELDRVSFPSTNRIINPCSEQGMFGSIQCAARWVDFPKQLSHCVIVLGDQPHIQLTTLKRLVRFVAQTPDKVCQPAYRNRARHPVFLPAVLFRALAESKAGTLKQALCDWEISLCECDDPGLDFDLDTPADYQRALAFQQNA